MVGLGNPGTQYEGNRHNLGFMVVDELLRRCKASAPRAKFGAAVVEAELAGERTLFCKPMEFMNVSGQAVGRVAQFWKIPAAQTLVVYDEIDLPFGQLRLAGGGGHGGHNGVRSLINDWGQAEFHRVRVGVGRPAQGRDVAGYLLSDFSRDEQKELPFLIVEAADAAEAVVKDGLTTAMNRFNAKKKPAKI